MKKDPFKASSVNHVPRKCVNCAWWRFNRTEGGYICTNLLSKLMGEKTEQHESCEDFIPKKEN